MTLELLAPELKPGLEEFRAAQNDQEKRFAAILLILRMPGLRPYVSAGLGRTTPIDKVDSFQDNWWCPLGGSENLKSPNLFLANDTLPVSLRAIYPDGKVPFPEFLAEPQRSVARDEWLKLSSIGTAPNFIAEQVITWSKQTPSDTRVAEALYLTVEATRWGCVNRETSELSKQAFQILHHQYPSSPWAGKAEHSIGGLHHAPGSAQAGAFAGRPWLAGRTPQGPRRQLHHGRSLRSQDRHESYK